MPHCWTVFVGWEHGYTVLGEPVLFDLRLITVDRGAAISPHDGIIRRFGADFLCGYCADLPLHTGIIACGVIYTICITFSITPILFGGGLCAAKQEQIVEKKLCAAIKD